MSANLLRPGQAPFAQGDGIFSGTDAEYSLVGRNNITYAGRFWLDESTSEPLLVHEAKVCCVPKAVGAKMARKIEFKEEDGEEVLVLGDKMVLPGDDEGVVRIVQVTWGRAEDNSETKVPEGAVW